jgi:hypothetical protein
MTDTAVIEQRDGAIVEALVAGRSVRLIQREFSLTVVELDQALERCFPLDTAARLRTIRGDLGRLDRLIEKFYLRAIASVPWTNTDAQNFRLPLTTDCGIIRRSSLGVCHAPEHNRAHRRHFHCIHHSRLCTSRLGRKRR